MSELDIKKGGKKSRNKTMKSHIKKRQTKHKQIKKGISKKNKMNKRISKKRKIGGSRSGNFTITDEMLNAAEKRRLARLQMKNLPSLDLQSLGQAWREKAMKEIKMRRMMHRNDPRQRQHISLNHVSNPAYYATKGMTEEEMRLWASYYDSRAENERKKSAEKLKTISENEIMANNLENRQEWLDIQNLMDTNELMAILK